MRDLRAARGLGRGHDEAALRTRAGGDGSEPRRQAQQPAGALGMVSLARELAGRA